MNQMSPLLLACAAALGVSAASLAGDLTLSNGDRLTGPIVEQTADHVVIEHETLGRLEIARDRIEGLELSDNERVALSMLQDDGAAAEAAEEPEWKSSFRLGLGASYGNSDDQNLSAGLTSKRETDRMRTTLDLGYFYSAADGDRTENRFTAGLRNDWLIPESRWFIFAQGRYDYDEFQTWEHRLAGHGGVGYELIKKDNFKLNLRGGAGVTREWNIEDTRPELLFGADLEWQITEKQSLIASGTIYPDLDDTGEFRTLSTAMYSAVISDNSNMAFNIGVEHEYQSTAIDPVDKNDVRLFAGLQFDF